MAKVTEIATDVFRISTYIPQAGLQFNQFLVKDQEPLLFHTGLKGLFQPIRDEVAKLIPLSELKWIAFSHFEADECGSLNDWLQVSPSATALCSIVGANVSVNDFAIRPPRSLKHKEILNTGKYRFRFFQTPQVPHAWDAGLMFEEVNGTLFCSDLFHQNGDVEPTSNSSVIERMRQMFLDYQKGPLAYYMQYTKHTDKTLRSLADLSPKACATMHGSTYLGDGKSAILEMAKMMERTIG
jgi:flavorubredoxin